MNTGFWRGNVAPGREWGLGLNERTVGEMLRGYGYSTHMVGIQPKSGVVNTSQFAVTSHVRVRSSRS